MVQVLGWSAAGLACLTLVGVLWWRSRNADEPSSRQGSSVLMVLALAILANVLPALVGASETVRIAGSLTSMFLLGVLATLLVRR